MKKIMIFFLFSAYLSSQAQTILNKDSLMSLLPTIKDDTTAVDVLINLGQQYENTDPELAKYYYRKAGDISKKIQYQRGVVRYIANYTYVLNLQSRFDSSLALNLQAVSVAKKIGEPLLIGKALFNAGTSYRLLSQYENAIAFYEEGKKVFSGLGDSAMNARAYDILQLLYYNLENYQRAIEYGEEAVRILRAMQDKPSLGLTLNNLGLSYSMVGNSNKALDAYKEVLVIARETDNVEMEATVLLNIADQLIEIGRFNDLKGYYERALTLFTNLDGKEGMAISHRGLAICYLLANNLPAAKIAALESLRITSDNNLLAEKKKTLSALAQIYFALHDYSQAFNYTRQSKSIGDSIINERIRKNTIELETRYESEKKEYDILKLATENKEQKFAIRQKRILNYVFIGSALALLLFSLLLYRNYHQKQKIQQQRINELEKEKQLSATEAVLKGEEQERSRLAKDLHDGLGGMLSGIKFSMNTMKGNLILTPEYAQAFERSIDMLDSSIREMRRVAHNLMPEALVKFGLDTALKDFCNDINQSGALAVNYQSIGLEQIQLDQSTSITVFRIVQELINNIMKHASAKNTIVQLTKTGNQLSVTVEDDGKGFDTAKLNNSKGIGWMNIVNRVDFMKGNLDVQSEPGKGTSVHIEIPV